MTVQDLTGVAIVIAWLLLLSVLARGRQPRAATTTTATRHLSRAGLAMQGIAYAMAFASAATQRPVPISEATPSDLFVSALAVLLAFGSAAFVLWAARTLGRQWSLTARIIHGHQLVVAGPYRIVRHPVYLAMLGMLWATVLAFSGPMLFVVATAIYLVGAMVRIRSEDALLRETFGEDFEAYRRRVPALIPWPRGD